MLSSSMEEVVLQSKADTQNESTWHKEQVCEILWTKNVRPKVSQSQITQMTRRTQMTSGHSWRQQLRNLFDANEFNGSASAKGVDAQICWEMLRYGPLGVAVLPFWYGWNGDPMSQWWKLWKASVCFRSVWGSWCGSEAPEGPVMHRDAGDVPSSSEFQWYTVESQLSPGHELPHSLGRFDRFGSGPRFKPDTSWHWWSLMVTDAESIESMA